MRHSILMMLTLFLGLSACTKNEDKPVEPVFKNQIEALEKAKQVEQLIQQHDIDQRKQMVEQAQ